MKVFFVKYNLWSLFIPISDLLLPSANGHIRQNTPVLVRSLKLSSVEPSQYLDEIKFGQFLYWIPNMRPKNAEMKALFENYQHPPHLSTTLAMERD